MSRVKGAKRITAWRITTLVVSGALVGVALGIAFRLVMQEIRPLDDWNWEAVAFGAPFPLAYWLLGWALLARLPTRAITGEGYAVRPGDRVALVGASPDMGLRLGTVIDVSDDRPGGVLVAWDEAGSDWVDASSLSRSSSSIGRGSNG